MSKLTRAGKKGLADAISSFFVQSDVKMSYAQSERLAEHIKQHMADSLRTTGVFGLRDFGQLSVVERGSRRCLNPKTKEPIEVPACKTVKFKISRSFKSTLQDKEYD